MTKKQPSITFDKLQIDVINESSGLFMDGPHTANQWRSYRKETTGWGQINEGTLDGVYSIVKDNDGVDYFDSEHVKTTKYKDKS